MELPTTIGPTGTLRASTDWIRSGCSSSRTRVAPRALQLCCKSLSVLYVKCRIQIFVAGQNRNRNRAEQSDREHSAHGNTVASKIVAQYGNEIRKPCLTYRVHREDDSHCAS